MVPPRCRVRGLCIIRFLGGGLERAGDQLCYVSPQQGR